MRSSYRRIGEFIQQASSRNRDLAITDLRGIKINKQFMPSVANTVGTDLSKYKVVQNNQFAYNPMHVGRDEVLPIALLTEADPIIVSPAYVVFEIIDIDELLPAYLMMWMRRSEFDRNAWFTTDSSVRGGFAWEDFCNLELPVPSIEKQREIVREYEVITDRIALNEKMSQRLEETAQALYKHWFVDFEFPMPADYAESIGKPELTGKPYQSSGGEMKYCEELDTEIPVIFTSSNLGEEVVIKMGQSPKGESYNNRGDGIPLVNGPVEFGNYFTIREKWTTSPTKICNEGDLIVCVRGSTTGKSVISDGEYCLGRGVASFYSKWQNYCNNLYYESKPYLLSLTTGSTFPNWSRDELRAFPVIGVTTNIKNAYENHADIISSYRGALEKTTEQLRSISTIILQKLSI